LVGRVNYSIVAQSMLIVSFATLLAATEAAKWICAEIGIAVLGMAFAIIQFSLSRSLVAKLEAMEKVLKQGDHIFKVYIETRSKLRPPHLQRSIIPGALFIIWVWLVCVAALK
jgi:hypothetical protein